uniref:Putative Clavata3/esr-related 16 n=1 Tax=Davidia involucrata TaxID=16924 RepID=A0A5B7AUJ8_DAVIN
MTTVSTQGVRTRRRIRNVRAKIAVFFFWVILIFTQLCLSSAEHNDIGRSSRSPARNARFFNTASSHAASSPPQFDGSGDNDSDTLYGEDKRLVHTGPNPLHN